MDIKNMKMVIGLVVAIVAQAFGMIWYIAQLDSTVSNLDTTDALIENEMRTIMSDHSDFGDILKDMGKDGYGDNRQYGDY